MASIERYAIKAGVLQHAIELSDLVDRRFIPEHIEAAKIEAPAE
jgi:hypothetical protein